VQDLPARSFGDLKLNPIIVLNHDQGRRFMKLSQVLRLPGGSERPSRIVDTSSKLRMLRRGATLTVLVAAMSSGLPACAEDVSGIWLHEAGTSKVRIAKCGDALCGHIVWLKSDKSPAKVGQRIFYDMKPSGENAWQGSAFDPESEKTYTGKMTVSGNALKTSGCALGGLICRSVSWSRSN
jgi:uncharacterized protein (DUF2147 family)